ncbi:MAG: radical SAM protein [Pseudomonadota bacterium]
MRILLVVPRAIVSSFSYISLPAGIAYISSSLKKAGHDVRILDMNNIYTPVFHMAIVQMMLKREMYGFNPQVIGTGGLSGQYDQLYSIIESIRILKLNVTTIIGGGCVSSEPELIMENIKADFGVIGEGEQTIIELVNKISRNEKGFESVDGIIYRENNKIIKTRPRKPVQDLDTLPYPDYEGLNIEAYLDRQTLTDLDLHPFNNPRVIDITASRSCPFKCTFCFHPAGDKYRKRSIDSVISEIEYWVKTYQVNLITINDELFANDKKWLLKFCREIKAFDIKWQVQLRVDIVNQELIKLLKESGCIYISYGLESASPKILKSMKKKITIEQIENALELTRKNELNIQGNFIFGDKAETIETMVETLNWWFKHPEYNINLSRIVPYPGTQLYKYAIEKNLFKNDRIEYLKNGFNGLKQLNLTQIPDDHFTSMLGIILNNLRPGNLKPGILKGLELKGTDPYQGHTYSAQIECPYCKTNFEYFPIHSKYIKFALRTLGDFGFGCRKCNQRMTFLPLEIEKLLFDISNGETSNRFAVMGNDKTVDLFIRTSYFAQTQCKSIISEESQNRNIRNVPVRRLEQIKGPDVLIDGLLIISKMDINLKNRIEKKGIPIYDISDEFRFLKKCTEGNDIQEHLNYMMQKINNANASGNLNEVSFLLLDLLELYPTTLDIHRNILDNAVKRNDINLILEASFFLSSVMSTNNFKMIKDFLISIFPRMIEIGKIPEAKELITILLFNNPQEDQELILSLKNKLKTDNIC